MPVILAPMSGVSDLPFRRLVKEWGAGLVVSEMIASHAMVNANRKTQDDHQLCRRAADGSAVGRDDRPDGRSGENERGSRGGIIDINMGCPVKKVVNKQSGSALMRDLGHARKIIEATVKAVDIPVTLKMRKGWDDDSLNAPELARIAENEGVQLITVHGRTRCQMYTGRPTSHSAGYGRCLLPVIANGDIQTYEDVDAALEQSGAAGVMIGRGATGRPWFLGQVVHYLASGERRADPDLSVRAQIVRRHFEDMLDHFGGYTGLRMARKHLAWYSRGYKLAANSK